MNVPAFYQTYLITNALIDPTGSKFYIFYLLIFCPGIFFLLHSFICYDQFFISYAFIISLSIQIGEYVVGSSSYFAYY